MMEVIVVLVAGAGEEQLAEACRQLGRRLALGGRHDARVETEGGHDEGQVARAPPRSVEGGELGVQRGRRPQVDVAHEEV